MKKSIILLILMTLLFSCINMSNRGKCIDYKGPNRCSRLYDGTELIYKEIKDPKIIIEGE